MPADELDHVNAHATSTPEGDGAELQALATLLGEHGPAVSISAQKSMLGHTLGAAGALESVATIQAIREGAVPPTINLHDPDESVNGLDVTPNKATRRPIRAALNNSFGFGGQNAALVFTRFDG
jgi:3-oxoacyl-[acyl-carrier-protein] synthase II